MAEPRSENSRGTRAPGGGERATGGRPYMIVRGKTGTETLLFGAGDYSAAGVASNDRPAWRE